MVEKKDELNVLTRFMLDGKDREVQDVISKLRFIAKIKEGEKIDVKTMTLQDTRVPWGWKVKFRRTFWVRGESRNTTYEFIMKTLTDAIEYATKYLRCTEPLYIDYGRMILTTLSECKIGLDNLVRTYSSDKMYISRIETLKKTLDTKLEDLKRLGPPS